MSLERSGIITFRGKDVTVQGEEIKVGDMAPEFNVQTQDWAEFQGLADTTGKVRVLAAVPSLDTEVCDREARRFNQEAANLGGNVSILIVSMDLPYAQKRWCGGAGIDQVITLSDHHHADFGLKYGCLLKEVRLLRRAVFVVDQNGKVTYAAYMPALGVEPNYEEVLEAVRTALK